MSEWGEQKRELEHPWMGATQIGQRNPLPLFYSTWKGKAGLNLFFFFLLLESFSLRAVATCWVWFGGALWSSTNTVTVMSHSFCCKFRAWAWFLLKFSLLCVAFVASIESSSEFLMNYVWSSLAWRKVQKWLFHHNWGFSGLGLFLGSPRWEQYAKCLQVSNSVYSGACFSALTHTCAFLSHQRVTACNAVQGKHQLVTVISSSSLLVLTHQR